MSKLRDTGGRTKRKERKNPPFPEVVTTFLCSRWSWWNNILNFPISSCQWIDAANPWCLHWVLSYVPSWWSVLTPSCCQKSSAPLLAQILSPFTIVLSIRPGVTRGRRDSLSWQRFPLGRFCLSSYSLRIYAVAYLGWTLVRILLAGPPVGTGRLVPLPRSFDFSNLRQWRCIFETALDFVGTFQFRRLVLGVSYGRQVIARVVRWHKL